MALYNNSSLKSGRAALNRHFKGSRGLDIIANSMFIKTNEIFKAVTKKGKVEGCGETKSKESITDPNLSKLRSYFLKNMNGPPNPKLLQEMVLFNIIYFGGRRGRENLRLMTKDTFTVKCDHDGRENIQQIVKECDKNHQEDNFSESNSAHIYANPGNIDNNLFVYFDTDETPWVQCRMCKHKFHLKCVTFFYCRRVTCVW